MNATASRPALRATRRNISDQYNIACTLWSLISVTLQMGLEAHRDSVSPVYSRWIMERELKSPKTFRSHRTTTITTNPFKIDLMDPAIGM